MDDQRHTAAMSDADVDRELARALAVEPSPEFAARVRTRIASEPAPRAVFATWNLVALGAAAAVILAAVLLTRSEPVDVSVATNTLASRTIGNAISVPDIESGFRKQYGESGFSRTLNGPPDRLRQGYGGQEGGLPGLSSAILDPQSAVPSVLLDPRETRALRSLLAGLRDNRVDLTPLLQPGAPAAMDLPPVENLVIAPLAIDPLDPISGESARSGQGERQ